MNRREFVGLSGGAAATLAMKPVPGMGTPEEAALGRHLAAAARAATDPGTRTYAVTVTSEFMEDYTAGTQWVPPMKIEIPYASKDGAAQIFSFSGAWSGGPGDATVDRIHPDPDPATHPDQSTLTGWSLERTVLPPEQGGAAIFAAQAIIVPGSPDRLIVYRRYSVLAAPLADDGTVGRFNVYGKSSSIALITGQLPAGSRYVLENGVHDNRNSAAQDYGGPVLRDLTTFQAIPIDRTSFPQMTETFKFHAVYTMKGVSSDSYRMIVHTEAGGVVYLVLALDRSNPSKPVFKVAQNWELGNTILPFNGSHGCLTVHESTPGQVQVTFFDFPGLRQHAIKYDPNGTGPDQFTNVYPMPITDQGPGALSPVYPAGTTMDTRSLWNADANASETFILIKPPNATEVELWSLGHRANEAWEPLSLVDKGLRDVAIFDASEVTLLVSRPHTGFEIWKRNGDGDWDTEHVRVQAEGAQMLEVAGYRVGVTMQADGMPAGGEEIGVTATISTGAVIQTTHCALGIHRPFRAKTESTGTLWITVLLEDRLSFPSLVLTSKHFKDRLVVDLNNKIDNFMSNVTEDQLLGARDRRRCTDRDLEGCTTDELGPGKLLVTDPDKAKKAASLISKTMAAAPKQARLDPNAEGNIRLTADIHAGWVPHHVDLRTLRTASTEKVPSWHFYKRDGVPHLELVSSEFAVARISELTAMTANGEGGLFDFVTDAIDSIGNACKSIYDGVCDVVEAVADGLKIFVTLVVDGFNYAYSFVLDTIEQVMDAVEFFLDYAGMLIGMAIGWILEQLGFLFDWKAIKERRNLYKRLVTEGVGKAITSLGDPRAGVADLKKYIGTAKTGVVAALNKIRSSPADSETMGQRIGDESTFPDLSFVSGMSLLPHVTWLLDKVQSAMPRRRGGIPTLDIPKLQDLALDLGREMMRFTTVLAPAVGDISTLLDAWIIHGQLFTSSALDPIIDLLLTYINRFLDALIGVIEAGAALLGAFYDNPGNIVKWLDSKINVPFFAGFYRGLTGNDLSAFDVGCLIAAIPSAVHSEKKVTQEGAQTASVFSGDGLGAHLVRASDPRPMRRGARLEQIEFGGPMAAGEGGAGVGISLFDSDLGQACAAFSIADCIVSAINAGITAASNPNASNSLTDALTALNLTTTGCWWILDLVLEGPKWEQHAVANLIEVAGTMLLMACAAMGELSIVGFKEIFKAIRKRVDIILIALIVVNFVRALAMSSMENVDQIVSLFYDVFQKMTNLVVRQRESSLDPFQAIGVGVFVGVLAGLKTTLFLERPAENF
jgi:hypothetical protein